MLSLFSEELLHILVFFYIIYIYIYSLQRVGAGSREFTCKEFPIKSTVDVCVLTSLPAVGPNFLIKLPPAARLVSMVFPQQ